MAVPLGGTGLSYASSAFLAIILETLFYGLFLFMFITSTFVLYRKRPRNPTASLAKINLPLLSISSAMFIFGTIHLAMDAYRAMESFVYYPGGAFAYLIATGTNTPLYVSKNVLYHAQTFLGDMFMIYRLYKVWGGNKLICLPFILCFIASIAAGAGALATQTLRKPSQSIFSSALHDWPLAFLVMTLVVNAGCTALIAYRAWVVNCETKLLNVGTHVHVAVIMLESGLLYTIASVIQLALYMNSSGAYKIAQDTLMQIIGLIFCGIIASVGLGLSDTTKHTTNKSTKTSALVFGTHSSRVPTDSLGDPDSTIEQVDVEKGQA
ncbi:hypothetical protein MVEN_02621400 [Mycena venus]|uniref:Uncharacterized protein n=1 Tax=Mycena venus TaxID=2733690 RepID=A0A8H6U123_9AGAR|nr:hypothetical protein MVEN_02621400 [Mycena venus]